VPGKILVDVFACGGWGGGGGAGVEKIDYKKKC
jgi:hypothetical protein